MKKLLFVLLSLICVIGFFSCVQDKGKLKVGLSLPTQREERWVRDKERMQELAKQQNIALKVQISDNDAAKQIAQCENLISQGVAVLIIAPHDATSAAVIVEKAHKAGIKVISYDRLILSADVDMYISFDNEKVGELQGEYLTKLVPKGNYVVLSGASTDNNAALFKKGAMKFITPLVKSGAIKIVMEQPVKDWQPSEAQKLMEQALTANQNKIDAVLAPNDGTAGGCIQALSQQKMQGKVPVTGQDAELAGVIRIIEGVQTITIFKDTQKLGETAIMAALKIAKGEKPEVNGTVNNKKIDVPAMLLTPVVVDKKNYEKILVDSGYIKKQSLVGKN